MRRPLVQDVVEQEQFVTHGLEGSSGRLYILALLRFYPRHHRLLPVADRNLYRLPGLEIQSPEKKQAADRVVDAPLRVDLFLQEDGVLRQIGRASCRERV